MDVLAFCTFRQLPRVRRVMYKYNTYFHSLRVTCLESSGNSCNTKIWSKRGPIRFVPPLVFDLLLRILLPSQLSDLKRALSDLCGIPTVSLVVAILQQNQ